MFTWQSVCQSQQILLRSLRPLDEKIIKNSKYFIFCLVECGHVRCVMTLLLLSCVTLVYCYSKLQLIISATGKPLPTRRGLGISAWGIIAIIISAIMLVAGTYYFFIFYPLICKKERNYDVMELHQSPV